MPNGYQRPINRIGQNRDESVFGYMGKVLTKMANSRRWAVASVDSNGIVVNQAYPLQLLQQTPTDLLNAVRIASQGSAVKAYQQALMPAAGADLTLNLGSVRSFGVRVRITDSPLNFKFGAYTVTLRDGTTDLAQVVIVAAKLPAELFLLGISNAGGQATATTIANPQVVIAGSASGSATVTGSTSVWAETLNLRDIGVVS